MRRILRITGGIFILLLIAVAILIALYRVPDRPVDELKPRWAQQPSQFISISGMQVHIRDEGPREDSTPIVLLHGTSASLHTWDGWVDALKSDRRVVRFDLPGFGLTGPNPDGNYTIENYAAIVVAVLDRLKIDRCILSGNSFGGYVSWATAVLHPDRIDKLVLVDSSGYPYEAKSVPIGFKLALIPGLNRLIGDLLPRGVIESSLKNVYGNPSLITTELIDRYFDITIRAGNRKALIQRFRQAQPGSLAKRVPEIKQPTLIIWGGRDRLIPPHIGKRFHSEIETSKFVLFEELGHVPHEEDPTKTVNALKAFLARIP